MGHEFEIRREVELPASPEQVWEGITTGVAGWQWSMEFEPGEGGMASDGSTITAWDPPNRFAVRAEGPDGWYNELEYLIEARDGGTTVLRAVHSGIFGDDWEGQYDGANKHWDFYLHTFGQYLRYFSGRQATYVSVDGPVASATPDAFEVLQHRLGIADGTAVGDTVHVELPGVEPSDAVVDYRNTTFLGLRTANALYRFFGRNAFGAPISVSLHLFAEDADGEKADEAWSDWIQGVFAGSR